MDLNSIIFPAPTEDKRYELYRNKDQVIFIPKKLKNGKDFHIPCFIQPPKRRNDFSNKFLFYFHGNAEDIFNSTGNLEILRNSLPVNISSYTIQLLFYNIFLYLIDVKFYHILYKLFLFWGLLFRRDKMC